MEQENVKQSENTEHIFGGGVTYLELLAEIDNLPKEEIGRASCRERV